MAQNSFHVPLPAQIALIMAYFGKEEIAGLVPLYRVRSLVLAFASCGLSPLPTSGLREKSFPHFPRSAFTGDAYCGLLYSSAGDALSRAVFTIVAQL